MPMVSREGDVHIIDLGPIIASREESTAQRSMDLVSSMEVRLIENLVRMWEAHQSPEEFEQVAEFVIDYAARVVASVGVGPGILRFELESQDISSKETYKLALLGASEVFAATVSAHSMITEHPETIAEIMTSLGAVVVSSIGKVVRWTYELLVQYGIDPSPIMERLLDAKEDNPQ